MRVRSRKTLARRHNIVLVAVMAAAMPLIAALTDPWRSPAYSWGVATIVYLVLVWGHISRLDASGTAAYASSEEPSKISRVLLVNLATLTALASVGLLMVDAAGAKGLEAWATGLAALAVVAASWLLITTVFILRYADVYYAHSPVGGMEFNQEEDPTYLDFAYAGFSLGMTYQISDTAITQSEMRRVALVHSIYAFVFGIAITATSINLVMSLGS